MNRSYRAIRSEKDDSFASSKNCSAWGRLLARSHFASMSSLIVAMLGAGANAQDVGSTPGNDEAPPHASIANAAQEYDSRHAFPPGAVGVVKGEVDRRTSGSARDTYAGVAAAMAVQMPAGHVPGKTVLRVGTATFKGEGALGVSIRRTSENYGWSLTGGVGLSRAGVAATVGAEWIFN